MGKINIAHLSCNILKKRKIFYFNIIYGLKSCLWDDIDVDGVFIAMRLKTNKALSYV